MAVPRRRTERIVTGFFALVFVVYFGLFPYIGVVNNPNENTRTFMTMALVEEHSFKIDNIVARHGWTNDMARVPDKKHPGTFHLSSVKGPAVSYAGVVPYFVFCKLMKAIGRPIPTVASTAKEKAEWLGDATWFMRVFAVQLPCFLFLVFFERMLRRTTQDVVLRLAAVTAVGIGTNYLAYSQMFVSHSLFAVAAFGSFAATVHAREREPRKRKVSTAFLAGFFASLATLLEYHALPVSASLSLFALVAFYRPKLLASVALGGALPAAAMALFQWRAFGDPLVPGHRMLENQQFASLSHQGFFGMQMPDFDHASLILLSRTYGLFGTSPYLWLGLLALPFAVVSGFGGSRARKRRALANAVAIATVAVLVLTVAASNIWRGGWTVGPRYLGAAPPFLAYMAVCALERLGRSSSASRYIAQRVAAGAAAAGVAQLGIISVLCNTVPESVGHPLTELAIPLLRAGFVPRHVGDLVGIHSPIGGYVVIVCLVLAGVAAIVAPGRRKTAPLTRISGTIAALAVAALLVLAGNRGALEDGVDGGANARNFFATVWEPAGRDQIAKLRERAAMSGDSCTYAELSRYEAMMGLVNEAAADAAMQKAGSGSCR